MKMRDLQALVGRKLPATREQDGHHYPQEKIPATITNARQLRRSEKERSGEGEEGK